MKNNIDFKLINAEEHIEFVRKLPVSMTGKVQRRELQEKDMAKLDQGKEIKG